MAEDSFCDMAEVLAETGDVEVIRHFLEAILTPSERAAVLLRWKLVCMLESGMSQRAIAKTLGVSLCKITRGSRELKHGPETFRKLVRKNVNKERKK